MEKGSANLKSRFNAIIIRSPRSIREICNELNMSYDAINSFMTGKRKTSFRTLCVIEGWIQQEEGRLGII